MIRKIIKQVIIIALIIGILLFFKSCVAEKAYIPQLSNNVVTESY